MKLSILNSAGDVNVLELPEGDNDLIVQLIAAEVGIPVSELTISHYGNDFSGDSFSGMNLKDEDIISVGKKTSRKMHLHDIPPNVTPEHLLELIATHPHLLDQLQSADPEMTSAVRTKDPNTVRMLMMKRLLDVNKMKYDEKVEEDRIWANPDTDENQRIIAERIRQQNIEAQMTTAINEMPEAFGSVHMLYINIEVNGHPVKAFVDSGAQSTIMSEACAERCGVARLVDTRFAGEARGVGTARILGRVHIAQMKLGSSFFPISLTVLQNNDVDMLFGLDMLKRHRCIIDLSDNVLRIETASGLEEAQFLAEADIPKKGDEVPIMPPQSRTPPPMVPVSTSVAAPPQTSSGHHSESSTPRRVRSRGNSFCGSDDAHLVNQDVIHLTSLGFSIVEASNALSQAEGDVQLAAELLFASRT